MLTIHPQAEPILNRLHAESLQHCFSFSQPDPPKCPQPWKKNIAEHDQQRVAEWLFQHGTTFKDADDLQLWNFAPRNPQQPDPKYGPPVFADAFGHDLFAWLPARSSLAVKFTCPNCEYWLLMLVGIT